MINKLFGLVIILFIGSSCSDKIPTIPTVVSSDTISYRVIGSNVIGNVLIDYVTPTSGVVSLSSTLITPFISGPIAGYNQFVNVRPAITVSILVSGCVDSQILINAIVVAKSTGCGPITFSVRY